MQAKQIIAQIEQKDLASFEKNWTKVKDKLSLKEKQGLLTEIIEHQYSDYIFSFYVKVFDKIIDSKVSLDFNIDHWAPTFLSLAIDKSSRKLFDYLLRKGAGLNFIGDCNAFKAGTTIKEEAGKQFTPRFFTCLDFAKLKLADSFTVHYNYSVPLAPGLKTTWKDLDEHEEITIKKRNYYNLVEQSQYLHDQVHTGRLVEYIKSLGGKTFEELNNK